MTRLRPVLALAAGLAVVAGSLGSTAFAAPRAPAFAAVTKATITPGVQTVTSGAQCTSNFVYTDGRSVFIGQSAHCAGLGAATETDGCLASSLPLGTAVTVAGASRPGRLVYSSWLAMQKAGERDADTCAFNDFALVRLDPADVARTNPSVPVFGGPTGLDVDGTRAGEQVASYGNSSLRMGVTAFSPKTGVSLGSSNGNWTQTVYTATPGIPGDSGSGLLDSAGRAFGTLSTLNLLPYAGGNGVGDLSHELAYARSHGMPGLRLVKGTEAFRGVLAR